MNQPAPEPVVGILGGMGPEAALDLMARILRLTPASDDAHHIRCLVDQNPKVPSRIKALIERDGISPGPCMAEMARGLQAWGADFLAIPCNTAHFYYDDVAQAVNIPVLHLIDLTVDAVLAREPGLKTVGILASPAVRDTGLYTTRFQARGVRAVYPPPMEQEQLLAVIRAVKAGYTDEAHTHTKLGDIAAGLARTAGPVSIIACTELSVLSHVVPARAYDAAEILAEEIVAVAKRRKQPSSPI